MMKVLFLTLIVFLGACAAKKVSPGAEKIMLVTKLPRNDCEFLGEVVGSQGNWWTDDITSTKNKMVGARNELRIQAFEMGANIVVVLESRNTKSALSFDIKDSTVIGNAYDCSDVKQATGK